MNELGVKPGVLEFSGPDAQRFLNGQITQDVRKVIGTELVLPSCVTDAKGKLQFRVWITEGKQPGSVLVFCREEMLCELEARLTKYLIADDVEVHEVGAENALDGFRFPGEGRTEAERIHLGIPAWGTEITAGMLPPEAGLDATDISYSKGCYIGQEVISRIKSAGKVNRRLMKFSFADDEEGEAGELMSQEGKVCGEVTSVAGNMGLGFLKRAAEGETQFWVADKRVHLRN